MPKYKSKPSNYLPEDYNGDELVKPEFEILPEIEPAPEPEPEVVIVPPSKPIKVVFKCSICGFIDERVNPNKVGTLVYCRNCSNRVEFK